jgi:hypothetical protein
MTARAALAAGIHVLACAAGLAVLGVLLVYFLGRL